MNIITQEAKKRQAIVKHAIKKGKTEASNKYGVSLSSVKRWCTRLSLGGNSDVALAHFVKEYADDVEEICFCVDNDKGGEKAIEAYTQKYEGMGYIVTREIPKLKDFNEDLVNLIRPHPNILRR